MVHTVQKYTNLNPMNETINQSHCIMPFRGRRCRDNHDVHAILEIKGEDQAMTIEPVKLPD